MKRLLLFAVLAVLLFPLLSHSEPADSFSRRVNVAPRPLYRAYAPWIFLDRAGRPAVTYVANPTTDIKPPDTQDHVVFAWMRDGTWQDYSPWFPTQPNYWSTVAFDLDNLPHLGWPRWWGPDYIMEIGYSALGPDGWSTPILLSADDGLGSRGGVLVADSNGILHAFWNDIVVHNEPNGIDKNDIFWSAFDGVSWSEPVNISNYPSEYYRVAVSRVAADNQGGLHLVGTVQQITSTTNVKIIYMHYDGSSWGGLEQVDPSLQGMSVWPVIAVDAEGRPAIVWSQGFNSLSYNAKIEVYYSWRNGTWSSPRQLSNAPTMYESGYSGTPPRSLDPSLAFDLLDRAHVVWSENRDDRYLLMYTRGDNNTGEWEGPTMISSGMAEADHDPDIAIGPDNILHLTFQASDNYTGYYYNAYYSSLDLNLGQTLDQLWVPPVDAPLFTAAGTKAIVTGERGAGRMVDWVDVDLKVGPTWAMWVGGPRTDSRVTAAIYALDLGNPFAEPMQIFQSMDPETQSNSRPRALE